jgi:hypothetical protein
MSTPLMAGQSGCGHAQAAPRQSSSKNCVKHRLVPMTDEQVVHTAQSNCGCLTQEISKKICHGHEWAHYPHTTSNTTLLRKEAPRLTQSECTR